MQSIPAIEELTNKYRTLLPLMDERMRRQWAAVEAQHYGWGGIRAVAQATGLSVNTIRKGIVELEHRNANPEEAVTQRLRRKGGGRKCKTTSDPQLAAALAQLVEPATRGDPESPLRWLSKSTRHLATELTWQGHPVSERTVGRLLRAAGYSLQSNRKRQEGDSHPDRNAQFEHINATVQAFQQRCQPAISVDTKKKELVGNFKNGGCEWLPQGEPTIVQVHDFMDKLLGKAIPYGVYDLSLNQGWVSVGIDHDTAWFAVETIRRWWWHMGAQRYPMAQELLITADGGGSNGSRCRLWKVALQSLAHELAMPIQVCHFPPGTSKWNKIEHRMFCHITQNWRGRPLESLELIVHLIANTVTRHGLLIQAELDTGAYPTGIKVSDAELATINLTHAAFHGDWNYTVAPKCQKSINLF
ncbi:MAG: ISAzo13 family transposase [Caldilineaceae bacterium]